MSFISYAQNLEDVMLWQALKRISHGFYIDVGAEDPITNSVSNAFYEHGWRGMHITLSGQYTEKLRQARSNELVIQMSIGNQSATSKFPGAEDCLTMDSILGHATSPDIHWLKINALGYEKTVLEHWITDKTLPWILMIKSTHPLAQELSYREWEPLVLQKGYQLAYFDGINRFYVSNSHSALLKFFKVSPNCLDDFSLSSHSSDFTSLLHQKIRRLESLLSVTERRAEQAETLLSDVEQTIHPMLEKVAKAQADAHGLQKQIFNICASTSWRITRPIRALTLIRKQISASKTKYKVLSHINSQLTQLKNYFRSDVLESVENSTSLLQTDSPNGVCVDKARDNRSMLHYLQTPENQELSHWLKLSHSNEIEAPEKMSDATDKEPQLNLLCHYAWGESGVPLSWIADFNRHLQGMTCISEHTRTMMINNGLMIPLIVSGCGMDQWEQINVDEHYVVKGKPFRFLHVSLCSPQSGIKELLDAYGTHFISTDDVTLIIKTRENPNNELCNWLNHFQKKYDNYPDVHIIEEDLADSQMKALYQQCHALVAPSKAESFGLPIAKALLSELPVITTAWGGQIDFCTSETAWMVDYDFERAETHFDISASVWAKPKIIDLAKAMRDVYSQRMIN